MRVCVNRFCIVSLAAAFICSGANVAPAQTPREQVDAYVMVIKAEQAEAQGDTPEAVKLYGEALGLYRTVARQYPDWRPDLVQYRISYCMNQLERLKSSAPSVRTDTPAAPEPVAVATSTSPDTAALSSERDGLKERLRATEDALSESETDRTALLEKVAALEQAVQEAGKNARPKSDSKFEELKEAHKALEKENKALSKENRALAEAVDTLKDAAKKADEAAKADSERLAGEAVNVEAERSTWQHEREQLTARIAELQAAIIPEARLQEEADKVAQLTEDVASLKTELSARETEIKRLQSDLAAASSGESERLASLGNERGKLAAQVQALKETVDLNAADVKKARELRAANKDLEKKISSLESEIASLKKENLSLRKKLDEAGKPREDLKAADEQNRLTSQNAILIEEIQQFREKLMTAERKLREYERLNAGVPAP